MPQICLPIFPEGSVDISAELAYVRRDSMITYFYGHLPVYRHEADDIRSFRMITAQFCVTSGVRQSEIARAFGIPAISVKRAVKRFRESGAEGFYRKKRINQPRVLTPDVIAHIEKLLADGDSVDTICDKLSLKKDTLQKAFRQKRIHYPLPKCLSLPTTVSSSNKTQRNINDSQAGMGMGATNLVERVMASIGKLPGGVETNFIAASSVKNGGLLLAVPSLLSCGLLNHTHQYFSLRTGYYTMEHVFILLAFMSLARIQAIEGLRYCAPGEWGKLLGIDRIPEVRTIRKKVSELIEGADVEKWNRTLCLEWMATSTTDAHTLYIDGHVRVYHGSQTKLPRHYVARQRLCLRASVDYWVNAADGQPFFVVNKEVDPGLLNILENDIVPRLLVDVPDQPTDYFLQEHNLNHRFCLVFDREGYSPEFMKQMRKMHIACLTYHKFPKNDWVEDEFELVVVKLVSGENVEMKLAERGTFLGGKLWVREIRKLTKTGHQTAIIATDFVTKKQILASVMFARWSQENFFRYMRQHYGLDRVITYETEKVSDTIRVVNPEWRKLDSKARNYRFNLNRLLAKFAEIHLKQPIEEKNVKKYEKKKSSILEEINEHKTLIEKTIKKRKKTQNHINACDLPQSDKFTRLKKDSKHFIDTVKMIAYRAETAMVYTIREKMSNVDEARELIFMLFNTEADLYPDKVNKTLTIKLHHLTNASKDKCCIHLCEELNQTKTQFPGTDLTMVFKMVSVPNPRHQEV